MLRRIPDKLIVGATENVWYNIKREIGTWNKDTRKKGKWNVYQNGKVIKSFTGIGNLTQKILMVPRKNMKFFFFLFALILVSCTNSYKSPYGYNTIILYEYNGKPWDSGAMHNKLYNGELSDNSLYFKIEKLNYSLKKTFFTNPKIDSILFRENYDKIIENPECPAGNNRILLLSEDSHLKYVVKINGYCNQ